MPFVFHSHFYVVVFSSLLLACSSCLLLISCLLYLRNMLYKVLLSFILLLLLSGSQLETRALLCSLCPWPGVSHLSGLLLAICISFCRMQAFHLDNKVVLLSVP